MVIHFLAVHLVGPSKDGLCRAGWHCEGVAFAFAFAFAFVRVCVFVQFRAHEKRASGNQDEETEKERTRRKDVLPNAQQHQHRRCEREEGARRRCASSLVRPETEEEREGGEKERIAPLIRATTNEPLSNETRT